MTRKLVVNVLKLLFAAALIWYAVDKAGGIDTVVRSLSGIETRGWLLGTLSIFFGTCLSMYRWHVLMRSVGLDSTPWAAFRLGYIGVFFNNVVPGLTGGDLVKAIYITREHPKQRTDAVISVIVDRLIGIVALALIAAVVIPFDLARYGEAALGIYGFLAAAGLGTALVLSRRIKARILPLLGRFGSGDGFVGKIDRAVSMYRDRLGTIALAMVMSFAVHLSLIVGIWLFGEALARGAGPVPPGAAADVVAMHTALESLASLDLATYCSVIPIIMMISSLPIAPAGWGVGEQAFNYFFQTVGVGQAAATPLSLTYRLTATLISLLGGVFLVLDRKRTRAGGHSPAP